MCSAAMIRFCGIIKKKHLYTWYLKWWHCWTSVLQHYFKLKTEFNWRSEIELVSLDTFYHDDRGFNIKERLKACGSTTATSEKCLEAALAIQKVPDKSWLLLPSWWIPFSKNKLKRTSRISEDFPYSSFASFASQRASNSNASKATSKTFPILFA